MNIQNIVEAPRQK